LALEERLFVLCRELIAELRNHIPDAHEKITLFCGWYSNRRRGYGGQRGLHRGGLPEGDTQAALEARRSCLCRPTRPMTWRLTRRASGRMNRSTELATKPVRDDLPIPDLVMA